ncbi:MAG: ABC transporter permease subunit [Planctomycetes bacterium]|nr:ABC transporter permease subunit [Planctomycetota bacterium]
MTGLLAADPVAGKELRSVSRRWQTYVGRCLFVGITAYLLYEYWKQFWRLKSGVQTYVSVSQIAELGRAIFVRCEGVSIVLTLLAAVMAASDMLAREIRQGTLGLLLLTDLSPRQVVLGKFKGAMMIALALYLCSVPVLAIAVYMGGVGPADLARSAAFTLGLAAVGAAVSLCYSARLKSGGAAVAVSLPLLMVYLLVFGAADLLGDFFYRNWSASTALLHKGGVGTTVLALFLCGYYLALTLRHVRERTGIAPGPAELAREQRTLKIDELREQNPSKPRRILRTWRAVWEESPLLWKEFTLRPALRLREDWRTRCSVILFALFFASFIFTRFGEGAFFNLWGAFFTVAALAGGSLLFAPEKEGRQWLLLLSTPVTAVQIVRAKLLCGLIFPEAMGLIVLYGMALLSWIGIQSLAGLAVVAAASTLFLLFCYALAATASLRSSTARSAFLFSAGVVAFLVTAPPLLGAAIRPLHLMQGHAWNELWNWFEALDPVTVLSSFEIERHHPLEIPPRAVEMALRFFTLYLPVTLLLPAEMVWRFRRIATQA